LVICRSWPRDLIDLGNGHAGKGLQQMRALGDTYGVGLALINQAYLALHRGQHERATALLEECLPIFVACGDRRRAARTLMRLGIAAYEQRDYERAERLGRAGLATFRDLGFKPGIADCFDLLASVAAARGEAAHAARLFGALESLQERVGRTLSPEERTRREQGVRAIHRAIGEVVAKHQHGEGRALPLDAAIDCALVDAVETPEALARPLSPRELDVVALLAQGLTNRQIAERLIISERTVDAHVSRIFDKLALNTRTQAAVWAASQGLAWRGSLDCA
jgi:DNA-binding NarL/FixJ family response regulator